MTRRKEWMQVKGKEKVKGTGKLVKGRDLTCLEGWQGVVMDSLKFQLGPSCLTLLCPAGVSAVAHPQGRRPAAVFYRFGPTTLYAFGVKGTGKLVRGRDLTCGGGEAGNQGNFRAS
jgi:hypothetical protein